MEFLIAVFFGGLAVAGMGFVLWPDRSAPPLRPPRGWTSILTRAERIGLWCGVIGAAVFGLAGIAGVVSLFVFPPLGVILLIGSVFGLLSSISLVRPAQQAIDQERAALRAARRFAVRK